MGYRMLQWQEAERISEIDATHVIKNAWRKDDAGVLRLVEINWTDRELPNGFQWHLRRFCGEHDCILPGAGLCAGGGTG